MGRLGQLLGRCWFVPAVLRCLLAGFVFVSSFPSPAILCAAFGEVMRLPSEGEDSLPDDLESPERESSSGDEGLQAPPRRRSPIVPAAHRILASRIFLPWTVVAASRSRPSWLRGMESRAGRAGHFLAEGRALRLYCRSLIC